MHEKTWWNRRRNRPGLSCRPMRSARQRWRVRGSEIGGERHAPRRRSPCGRGCVAGWVRGLRRRPAVARSHARAGRGGRALRAPRAQGKGKPRRHSRDHWTRAEAGGAGTYIHRGVTRLLPETFVVPEPRWHPAVLIDVCSAAPGCMAARHLGTGPAARHVRCITFLWPPPSCRPPRRSRYLADSPE